MRIPTLQKVARLVSEESAQFAHFAAVAEVGSRLDSSLGSIVRRGPFAGMTYPGRISVGSTLYPKLLGSYELELQEHVRRLIGRGYRTIIDIGAAEGYYAVGLARCIVNARVFAFEANPAGMEAVRAMAQANGVSDRVTILGLATVDELSRLAIEQPALVVCDCEGCEHILLDPNRVTWLRASDLLTEVHQLHGTAPRDELLARFRSTHDATVIEVRQRDSSLYPELDALPPRHRESILFERTDLNGWILLDAKQRHTAPPTPGNGSLPSWNPVAR